MSIAKNWSRENLAWAGGLFEGEGSITITPGCAVMRISMTDKDVLERFRGIVGTGQLYGPKPVRMAHHKPQWEWYLGVGYEVQALLTALWPFLGERRKARVEQALRFLASRRTATIRRKVCANGHSYLGSNRAKNSKGKTICRECARLATRKYREKRTGNVPGHVHQPEGRTGLGTT